MCPSGSTSACRRKRSSSTTRCSSCPTSVRTSWPASGWTTRMVQLPPAHVSGVEIVDDGEYWAMWDRWGSKMRMPKDKPLYYDWVEFPIKDLTLEALDAYQWPEPDPPEVVAGLRRRAEELRATTDFALVRLGRHRRRHLRAALPDRGYGGLHDVHAHGAGVLGPARGRHHGHLHRIGSTATWARSASSSTSSPSGMTWPPSTAG